MKYAIVIPAGAVDEPVEELEGRTPLQAARLPALDRLAAIGRIGTARTVPPGLPASSEISVLSVLGYDPAEPPVPRGPLEAAARGIEVGRDDQVFRCNLVTITDGYLRDAAAGYIEPAQAERLINALNAALEDQKAQFHYGQSYRNLFIWKDAGRLPKVRTTDPQGILDQPARKHLPRGRGSEPLRQLVRWAQRILTEHDINHVRRDLGENPADGVWVYGQGPLPTLPRFAERFGLRGAMVAGANMVRGLARLIGWHVVDVPGATGLPDTDFAAKGVAAVAALERFDLVCVHVEAADEAGHTGNVRQKVQILEAIDRHIVGPLAERLKDEREYRMLVMPDHGTPVERRMHSADPTIFVMAGLGFESNRGEAFDEPNAMVGEVRLERGCDLMEYFLRR